MSGVPARARQAPESSGHLASSRRTFELRQQKRTAAEEVALAKRADEFEVQESARRRLTGAAGETQSETEADQLGRNRPGAKRRSASRTLLG